MDGFKQRIIGALIIVSLAVIFLPMLFDEPHEERERQTLDIPPEPETPDVSIDEPQEPEVTETEQGSVPPPNDDETAAAQGDQGSGEDLPMAENGGTEEQTHDQEEPVETLDKPEPSPEEQPDTEVLEGSYLVQLGSFGSADNARRLRDKVREADVEAYIESFERDGETLTRVFAGPFVDRSAAEEAKTELDESLGLDTLVISAGE